MRARPLLVLGTGACILATIVASSLDRDQYFFYSHQRREAWEYPALLVVFVVVAIFAETAVTYAVFARRRPVALWKPAAVALALLVPFGLFLAQWVMHSPRFWALHLIWVWFLIAAMGLTVLVSGLFQGYRAFRIRGAEGTSAVEQ